MQGIVDLGRYPLDDPGSAAWQRLVATTRDSLAQQGMANLPGFLLSTARQHLITQLLPRFQTAAFRHARRHNVYFKPVVAGLAPDHPALQEMETVSSTLSGDQLADTVLEQIYAWPEMAGFLAAVMGKPALHMMADPLARVNAMAYGAGEALNWHFDRSEFTTTLLLQAPQSGGDFEYVTDLRSDEDPNYDAVGDLVAGRTQASIAEIAPGTLNIFRGRNTAHRVTPSVGPDPRIVAVLSYFERPGVRFTPEEQLGFYGRTA